MRRLGRSFRLADSRESVRSRRVLKESMEKRAQEMREEAEKKTAAAEKTETAQKDEPR